MAAEPTRSIVPGEASPHRPRIARETRRLLLTAFLAVLTLWVLARIRFPDRPVTQNPVSPLLGQLTSVASFSDLASTVDDVRGRIGASLVALMPNGLGPTGVRLVDRVAAYRLRDDLAIAILASSPRSRDDNNPRAVVAADRMSGLTVLRVDRDPRGSVPAVWLPERLDRPRYLMASSPAPADVSLRPAFIGALTAVDTPEWRGPLWALPADTEIAPGTFLFTDDGELVGAVARYDDGFAVVPGSTLLTTAEELLKQPQQPSVDLGIEIQALTPRLAFASGADAGVVVAWVDPGSNASDALRPGDVIRTIDGTDVTTPARWQVRASRLKPGDTVVLGVVRAGASRDIQIKAVAQNDELASSLGLRMRRIPRSGVEIVTVDPGSAADAAGLETGDVITTIAEIADPTAGQVRSAFATAKRGDVVIVALTRGSQHRVVALQR